MNRKYSGFTLIEMLIVMGIIIILIAVGIAAGRFAINRAADIAHQNAADKLFTAVTSYLTDYREYPILDEGFKTALADGGILNEYLSAGEFQGGTDANYLYWTNGARSAALVCVSLGGFDDVDERGHYCTGTGFGSESNGPGSISSKDIDADDPFPGTLWCVNSVWENTSNDFGTEVASNVPCNVSYVGGSGGVGTPPGSPDPVNPPVNNPDPDDDTPYPGPIPGLPPMVR